MENNGKLKPKEGKQLVTCKSKPTENAITRRYIYSGAFWIFGSLLLVLVAWYRGSGMKAHVLIWAAFVFGVVQFVRGIARIKNK
ncbi:MAG TPA: hypothetical protein PK431_04755 [Chitinophagales bacterium]|nr:hypothetical protein [Chitinophagales bacterium]